MKLRRTYTPVLRPWLQKAHQKTAQFQTNSDLIALLSDCLASEPVSTASVIVDHEGLPLQLRIIEDDPERSPADDDPEVKVSFELECEVEFSQHLVSREALHRAEAAFVGVERRVNECARRAFTRLEMAHPLDEVASEVIVIALPHYVDAWRMKRKLADKEADVEVTRHGRAIGLEGIGASASSVLDAYLVNSTSLSSERLYGYLSILLVLLTIGTWAVPCTVLSVITSGAIALAVLAIGAVLVRSFADGPPFFRSLGILALSATSFFILFAFAYAVAWLQDPETLTWDGNAARQPRLGEMFLVSLGFVRAGGTIVADVHHAARITAYVQLLVGLTAIAGVAGVFVATVRRSLASGARPG